VPLAICDKDISNSVTSFKKCIKAVFATPEPAGEGGGKVKEMVKATEAGDAAGKLAAAKNLRTGFIETVTKPEANGVKNAFKLYSKAVIDQKKAAEKEAEKAPTKAQEVVEKAQKADKEAETGQKADKEAEKGPKAAVKEAESVELSIHTKHFKCMEAAHKASDESAILLAIKACDQIKALKTHGLDAAPPRWPPRVSVAGFIETAAEPGASTELLIRTKNFKCMERAHKASDESAVLLAIKACDQETLSASKDSGLYKAGSGFMHGLDGSSSSRFRATNTRTRTRAEPWRPFPSPAAPCGIVCQEGCMQDCGCHAPCGVCNNGICEAGGGGCGAMCKKSSDCNPSSNCRVCKLGGCTGEPAAVVND
jgi:hypothetical protein